MVTCFNFFIQELPDAGTEIIITFQSVANVSLDKYLRQVQRW